LTPTNFPSLRDLKDLTNQMLALPSFEKVSIKMLEKFAARLDVWLKEDPAYVEPEVDEVEPEVVKAPGRKRALFSDRTNGLLVNIPLVFFASKLI